MAYSFWKIFLIGQDFITLLIFFPFNILFWRHISFDYKNSNSFVHVFVVNCPFFKITSAKYALYSWKSACFITWTILIDTIVFKIYLRESLNFKISVGKEVLNLRKKESIFGIRWAANKYFYTYDVKEWQEEHKTSRTALLWPLQQKKAKIIIRKIHQSTEAYSALYQTIMKELFYENKSIIKKDYFCKEASLEMFDRVLNTP